MDQQRSEFDKLIEMRIDLNKRITTLEHTLSEMKNKYKSFTQNNHKKIYLYSLDSFFFQYKILQVEHEHYKRFLALINNRMYGDYYKLYVIIGTQCKESNLSVVVSMDDILAYKDLDPTFDYTIDDVKFIFGKIADTMEQLHELYKSNNKAILENNSNNAVGFSIAAFFTTLKYENIILNEQIRMYLDFIKFYQSSQMGHFKKALTDITRFSDEINGKILVNYRVEMEALVKPPIVQCPVDEQEPVIEDVREPINEPIIEDVREPEQEPIIEDVREPEQEPVKEPEQEPAKEPEQEPAKEPEQEPAKEPEQEPAKEPEQEPAKEPEQEPAKEPEQEPVKEPEQEPAKEPEQEPVKEPEQEPVKEPEQEPVKEPEQEPVKELEQEPAKEPEQEPAKEPESVIDQIQEPVQVKEPIIEQFKEPVKEVVAKPKNNTPKSRKKTSS